MSSDAIVLLKADHKEVKSVFKQFQQAGEDATAKKGELVQKMIELLTIHTYLENELIYPEVRRQLPDIEDDILESYEEHHVADVLCLELSTMNADHERFDAKTTVLIENVLHHIEEEEQEWFPQVRKGMSRKQLSELGERMLEMRKTAPRSPVGPKAMKKTVEASVKEASVGQRDQPSRRPRGLGRPRQHRFAQRGVGLDGKGKTAVVCA